MTISKLKMPIKERKVNMYCIRLSNTHAKSLKKLAGRKYKPTEMARTIVEQFLDKLNKANENEEEGMSSTERDLAKQFKRQEKRH
jgi:hypothetical protein